MRRLSQPCLQDPATNELGIALVQLALAGPAKQQFVLKGGCPSTFSPVDVADVLRRQLAVTAQDHAGDAASVGVVGGTGFLSATVLGAFL